MPRIVVLLSLLLLSAQLPAEPLRVVVSVAPLAWLVEQVGGDRVQVQTLVSPGMDPHAFEPTPAELAELQRADAYLAMALPFERAWLPRVRAANSSLMVVGLLAESHGQGQGHGRQHGLDPHIWTDPRAMMTLSRRLVDLLSRLRPAWRDDFVARHHLVAEQLAALDRSLAETFAASAGRTFLVHHPAWGHLAARYGLVQLAIEREGKEPGPRALAQLSAEIRRLGIRTLFVEPQASEHLAHGLADTLGVKIVPLDPLAADYPANMRRVAAAIEEAAR